MNAAAPAFLIPRPAVVVSVAPETENVATFALASDEFAATPIRPGQFNMLYIPGVGEVPISVSGVSRDGAIVSHTIRFVGRVTNLFADLKPGATIGWRGPFGTSWPIDGARERDVLLVAGGLGLAPLRGAVVELLDRRDEFGRLILLYGARRPEDLLFRREHDEWAGRGLEIHVTVDRADESWTGRVGVVTGLFRAASPAPGRTTAFICGPEIMMRFCADQALADGIAQERVYLSMERNMHCAVGLCGHCQLGPEFVCKDGPVFAHPRLARFLRHDHY